MTVGQLIEKLKEFPPELVVIHDCCSDYEELGDPTLIEGVAYYKGHYKANWKPLTPEREEEIRKYAEYASQTKGVAERRLKEAREIEAQTTYVRAVHFRGN